MKKEIQDLSFDQVKRITKEYGCASIADLQSCEKIHEITVNETKICLFKKGSHLIVAFFLLQAGVPVCFSKSSVSASHLLKAKSTFQDQLAA